MAMKFQGVGTFHQPRKYEWKSIYYEIVNSKKILKWKKTEIIIGIKLATLPEQSDSRTNFTL
jgi:hypothetical protein